MRKSVLVCLAAALFVLTACRRERAIEFDDSNPLALAPDVSWAVVVEPYAAFRTAAEWNAESGGHCRKGDILQILGKDFGEEQTVWYRFEGGWLPETAVAVYNNRFRAKTAADAL
ncbi:MAG: hypothetical protein K2H09_07515 [Treponemataceae bacterium]|nr:hypothetical protein [Treponemataceae bacterium]